MLIWLKSSSLVLVVIGSMPMPVCNSFHERLANNGKIMCVGHFRLPNVSQNNDLWRYHSLMPSCAGFLKPRKLRLGPLKSTFSAENFILSFSMSISFDFGAIRSWNVSRSLKSPKNPKKLGIYWRIRSFKVIEFRGNWKPVYDFYLINSNLGHISHHYWDTAMDGQNCDG